MQEHASLIKEQDKELDKLGDAVGRVKTLGKIMNDELAEQNVILEELESDVERADTGMQTMQKKLKGLVEQTKNSDRALYAVICCLVILLGFLTMMVLS